MSTDDKVSIDSTQENNNEPDSEQQTESNTEDLPIEIEAEAVELEEEADVEAEEEIQQLRQDLIEAQELAEKNQDAILRARAEIENLRRRSERDLENAHKYAVEKFANALLPVIDSLEMGLAAADGQGADIEKLKEGTQLTLKMFADTANKFGLETIDPTGEDFNPEFHQAMTMQETNDAKPNTVLTVMQKGYLLHGRLIRPAMVVVAKSTSPGAKQAGTDAESETAKGTKIDEKA